MLLVKGLVYRWLDPEERTKLDLSSPRYSPIFSFASQLERHFVKTYGSDCSGKIQKQAILGKLFGYPESAIKHYFVRIYSDEVFYPDTTGRDLLYIHNPECRESEHEQYENRINPFFKQLCPKSVFFDGFSCFLSYYVVLKTILHRMFYYYSQNCN